MNKFLGSLDLLTWKLIQLARCCFFFVFRRTWEVLFRCGLWLSLINKNKIQLAVANVYYIFIGKWVAKEYFFVECCKLDAKYDWGVCGCCCFFVCLCALVASVIFRWEYFVVWCEWFHCQFCAIVWVNKEWVASEEYPKQNLKCFYFCTFVFFIFIMLLASLCISVCLQIYQLTSWNDLYQISTHTTNPT